MVFIDTNPSFSIYTELAISAAERLITPVNADDSSRVATNAMFILLHGQIPPHPIYGSWTYAARAQRHSVIVPAIHIVVGNRLTQFLGAAAAFSALSDATSDTLFAAYNKHPTFFTQRASKAKTVKSFRLLLGSARFQHSWCRCGAPRASVVDDVSRLLSRPRHRRESKQQPGYGVREGPG
jgi:hypothetical protein